MGLPQKPDGVRCCEAFLNSSVFLLVGSLLIGLWCPNTAPGIAKMVFTGQLHHERRASDMGIVAPNGSDLKQAGAFLIGFSLLTPLVNASLGLGLASVLHLSQGNALLFMVLCASASYIAVPAAMRMTVPEANPSLYISSALGMTFPFNIIVGIPLYLSVIERVLPAGAL